MGWNGLDWSGLECGHVADSSECGNEVAGSVKWENFLTG